MMKLTRVMGELIHNNYISLAADIFPDCARGERPEPEELFFLQNLGLGGTLENARRRRIFSRIAISKLYFLKGNGVGKQPAAGDFFAF